ncbi:MAG: Uma2 family endonuclease [Cyanobacteriota bacterium]|nr:Uma2 family endonuclease [Cyanobacteriota bacterium]
MSEAFTIPPQEYPDISQMILEDDEPLDSFINEKQQRLLTTVFYSGADTGINVPFIAAANVGLFPHVRHSGIVPDAFLSLNIAAGENWLARNVRSYLFWEFGKPPDVVIEVVSPTPGNELGSKLNDYARLGIPYYAVYDPLKKLGKTLLRVFQLQGGSYVLKNDAFFPEVNLGLTLWTGSFEKSNLTWLRWCYADGNLIPTGDELAAQKNAELSFKNTELSLKDAEIYRKDAQLAEEKNRRKQALLFGIEMGLKFKFGDEGTAKFTEIAAIDEVELLEAIASQIPSINSLEELVISNS